MAANKRNRVADFASAQRKALDFAQQWLGANVVVPEKIVLDEEQFAALMNTVTRLIVQSYVTGYMEDR